MKNIAASTALLVSLAGCGIITSVAMNSVETTKFTVSGNSLIMNGEINSQTYDQFTEIMAKNPQIKVLVEQNVPGSMDDDTMIKLAYKVRALGLDTYAKR